MAKQEIRLTATGYYTLVYDPKSKAFQSSLKDYIALIDRDGDAEGMLKHVCFHIQRFGISSMVEGVGYVCRLGDKTSNQEPFSGIWIKNPDPDFEFEID